MSEIQYTNHYPDKPVIPGFTPGMNEYVQTPNGNVLHVLAGPARVGIFDEREYTHEMPTYMFGAHIETDYVPGQRLSLKRELLRAVICARGPEDGLKRRHPDIRPREQLQQAIDYFDAIGSPPTKFRALWVEDDKHFGTNAAMFRNYMNDHTAAGPANDIVAVEREEAAVMQTPTGKIMNRLGFRLDITTLLEKGGIIEVDFMRDKKEL